MKYTKIRQSLNIKYRIFQGGMAWIADASLAAAVSEAGGLGIISGVGQTEDVREQIKKAKTLTDKPFGVNIMLMAPNVDEIRSEERRVGQERRYRQRSRQLGI